ncbi:MAG: sigma-54 dependent transcriptional regulator [Bacteroidota bacterium]
MGKVRRLIPGEVGAHLQFSSTPTFLAGRALFHAPSLVLLDVNRDTMQLRESVREFASSYADVPIIALTNAADHASAVELTKIGITSYFLLPEERRKITEQITLLHNKWHARKGKEKYQQLQQQVYDFHHIIGDSQILKTTIDRAHKVIKNRTMTVLITGETGTGKELFARAVHYNGHASSSPFVDIACSALPETLLESELFGYEKGAFTDAKEKKIGLFELAGDGTIFLDEIGDISLAMQSKLLKVIEDRIMRRVGGIRDIPVRARIIAATSADLEAKMQSGEFRRDLYHRLKILPLELPSLRERKEDIPRLAEGFLKTFNGTYAKNIKGITHQALHTLMDHAWEGNVRELKHCIERAVLLEEGDWITEHDFEFAPHKHRKEKQKGAPVITSNTQNTNSSDTIAILAPISHASVEEIQLQLIRKVLQYAGGNKVKAARILKISRPRLDRILRGGEDR